MKKKISKNIAIAGVVVAMLNFNSCKKYEDGPGFSLRSKKARLVGEWEVVKYESEGVSELEPGMSIEFEFEKDGDFEFSFKYSEDGYSYSYSYTGDWEFSSDKEEIEIDFDGQGTSVDWEILRLTNKELWFEDSFGDSWELEAK